MSTSSVSGLSNSVLDSLNGKTSVSDKTNETSERFLKLLVTQMQNQDPLNPMDNAQVTSQMAQINTVTGIEKLNSTMGGMTSTFSQMQLMQGASLVGHQVLMEGNQLPVAATKDPETGETTHNGLGGFQLDGPASNVKVEVLDAGGQVIGTLNETNLDAGIHGFQWPVPANVDPANLTFRVTATSGNTTIGSKTLVSDTVDAVSVRNGTLNLELRHGGSTEYSKITSVA